MALVLVHAMEHRAVAAHPHRPRALPWSVWRPPRWWRRWIDCRWRTQHAGLCH